MPMLGLQKPQVQGTETRLVVIRTAKRFIEVFGMFVKVLTVVGTE